MSVPGGVLGIAPCMHANQWLRCTGSMMIDSYCHEDRCVAIPDLYMALTHCCKMSLYTAHERLWVYRTLHCAAPCAIRKHPKAPRAVRKHLDSTRSLLELEEFA